MQSPHKSDGYYSIHTKSPSWYDYNGYGFEAKDAQKSFDRLIRHIRQYDLRRVELEQRGGSLADVQQITALLNQSVRIEGYYSPKTAIMSQPQTVREALRSVHGGLHLEVRQLETYMPVYYICRTRSDYWSEYSLIVEDIYKSPGYPMVDDRFVKIMRSGHEVYYLRLSQFRNSMGELLGYDKEESEPAVLDDILYELGRHLFQAAWHEDQRPGLLARKYLGLKHFYYAIELLYLCLSGELCDLRNTVSPLMTEFFEKIYPQPAIRRFLEMLPKLDGDDLNHIPKKATVGYSRMSKAFSRFLSTETSWGNHHTRLPMWKIFYGNLSRLEMVKSDLKTKLNRSTPVIQSAKFLEKESHIIIEYILDKSS